MRIELLLDKLAKHDRLKLLLEQTTNLPADELMESLLKEFEQVAERYKNLSTFAGRTCRLAEKRTPVQFLGAEELTSASLQESAVQSKNDKKIQSLTVDPIKIELPSIDVKAAERSIIEKREEERRAILRKELDAVERKIQAEIQRDWDNKADEIEDRVLRLKNAQQFLRSQLAMDFEDDETKSSGTIAAEQPEPAILDDDILYVHAVDFLQSSPGVAQPYSLNGVKGIDGKSLVFVVEHEGLRWFVSTIRQDCLNVTKSGMLLLTRDESLQLHAAHEEILNRLRCEGILAPYEFGTVVRSKDEFVGKITDALQDIRSGIDSERRSHVWALKVFALDEWFGKTLSNEQPTTKLQGRGREVKKPSKRSDIKLLERMLQHEQKVAETVHCVLAGYSTSSDILSKISIGNGTTDDWKLILHASYTIDGEGRSKFFSTILELQEQYRTMGVMLEVRGASERFYFGIDSHATHAISA